MKLHKLRITESMMSKARERDNGAYNSMSFMNGAGNITGFLGEYMVSEIMPHLIHVDKFSHDFEYNGIKIDVKTKNQNIPADPLGYYEASVTVDSLKFQNPDYYIFCRVHGNSYGWVIGAISYEDLMRNGKKMKKGRDEGNMIFKKDSINIRYDQLKELKVNERH